MFVAAVGPHVTRSVVSAAKAPDPAEFTFGNAGRNSLVGPGTRTADLYVRKEFPLGKRARLEVRGEAFNAFNHPNFGLPDNDLASPNFGRVLEAGAPRLVQFGLKLIY